MAVAADPNFEWIDVDGRRGLRRLAGSSAVDPWKTEIAWNRDDSNKVVFTTELEGATLQVEVRATHGQAAPHRITIEMADGSALPPQVFSRLRITPVFDQMSRDFKSPVIQRKMHIFEESAWKEPFLSRPRPGRKGRPDSEYAMWAARYVSACRQDARRPIARLTKEHAGHTESMLRAILNKARNRGLLTATPQKGVAGGRLTKRALQLLRENRSLIDDDLIREHLEDEEK
jgi:hypothetical protein